MQKVINQIVKWMNDYLEKFNKEGFVIGISGGIDSTVLVMMLNKYFPNKYIAYWIDINSSKIDYQYVKLINQKNKINYEEINLNATFNQLKKDLNINEYCEGNVKSRLRMISLYAKAQKLNYLVIGTTNFNEYQIGYFTKYGDGASDILPLRDLLKSEIKIIAKILNVPQEIIDREPTAGLYENQTDEKEIGISYKQMDAFFLNENVDDSIKKEMNYKIKSSNHKRLPISYPKLKK